MTTGMEDLAAGASALAGQAEGLRAAVDNGQLVMDPEAAERVAKVYEEKAAAVQDNVGVAQRLITNGIFGDCFIEVISVGGYASRPCSNWVSTSAALTMGPILRG
ncbi:hypothetical protein ACWDKQ_23620, partial [Saccharopolyspora sp. NPDC000995]